MDAMIIAVETLSDSNVLKSVREVARCVYRIAAVNLRVNSI